MKYTKKIFLSLILTCTGLLFAAPLQVQDAQSLPAGCRVIGEVKVGDIAWGQPRADIVAGLRKEAEGLGGNYLLMDIKRVNHPKAGIYYWGWGTVGACK